MLRYAVAIAVVACLTAPCSAIPQFQKQFIALYADGTDEAYTTLIKKEAKCWVCHQGKSKKNRNVYGEAAGELLTKKDKKETEKIIAALQEIAEKSSDPDNSEAPTFGELIAAGKLPGGELEDLKAEPSDD